MVQATPDVPRPSAFGLALKITLPFVALFALLLSVLGLVLAREIINEIEDRVEHEQRFVLNTLERFGSRDFMLPQMHQLEADSRSDASTVRTEYVIFKPNGEVLSTLPGDDEIIKELKQQRLKQEQAALPANWMDFRRQVETLNGKSWLIQSRSYPSRVVAYHLYPYAEIEQAKMRAIVHIVELGSAGLLAVGLLGLLMAYWVARPVRRLAAAARQITTAGLNEAAPEAIETARPGHALDEIGELALAFKTMLESLRRSQEELLKNERLASTGKLAASVAHEIRNPLTSLRMTIEMMQQRSSKSGDTDETTREGFAVVLREIDRLALAVEELLTFARPRPPARQPVDLNQLVRDVVQFLEHQLVHARVGSRLELDPAMPAALPLDPNKIRQLLVNLILNAQQAIVRDGAVTVRTRWDAIGRRATLSVIDTGPGIAEEVREKVFELFVSTKAGGGGIGLAIAKQIAEEHGGAIGFETSPKGTTFNVELATA